MARRADVKRVLIMVDYDSYRENWQVKSDDVRPGGILAKTDTKEKAVDEAVDLANKMEPSKLVIYSKRGDKKTDTRMYS